jgi:sugar (pentulose or hexulose) kinase
MSQPRRIAVLDIGKTNAKVVVVDCDSGEEVAARRRPNEVLEAPPYPHYDVDGLWSFISDALATFARQPGYDAISITTHGAAAALIDGQGNLALPVIDYEHRYPEAIERAYRDLRPPFTQTFSPPLAGGLNLGAQIHYQKTVYPSDFGHTKAIVTYPQYWGFRLTGKIANEVTSLGCHTDLWRPEEGGYSSLVARLNIAELMPEVRSAFDTLGLTTQEVTASLGLAEPVPVFCGIHDSNASLLPHLAGREPPFSVVSTGTWVICFAVGGSFEGLDPARDCLANVDAYGRAVPSSRFMGGREFEMLAAELGPFDPKSALAAVPGVVSRGIMLLPNLAEGTGPFPGRPFQWVNGSGVSTHERWAAVCIYLALMTDTCLELIGAGGPVLVEGPFAANPVYLSALRSVTGRHVLAVDGSTGTAQGAALLAGTRIQRNERLAMPLPQVEIERYRDSWHNRAKRLST